MTWVQFYPLLRDKKRIFPSSIPCSRSVSALAGKYFAVSPICRRLGDKTTCWVI
jgi:hypothetical protein